MDPGNLADNHLAFPTILGLDFLTKTVTQINLGESNYELKIIVIRSFFVFINYYLCRLTWFRPKEDCRASPSLCVAMPSVLSTRGHPLSDPPTYLIELLRNQPPEMQPLFQSWPSVCSEKTGIINVTKHDIITSDDIPVRSRPYRVSPLKKR